MARTANVDVDVDVGGTGCAQAASDKGRKQWGWKWWITERDSTAEQTISGFLGKCPSARPPARMHACTITARMIVACISEPATVYPTGTNQDSAPVNKERDGEMESEDEKSRALWFSARPPAHAMRRDALQSTPFRSDPAMSCVRPRGVGASEVSRPGRHLFSAITQRMDWTHRSLAAT